MQSQFTSITDVTAHIIALDPGFSDELTDDQMMDIVRSHSAGRYEDITTDELDTMIVAAYMATGADAATARLMLTNA